MNKKEREAVCSLIASWEWLDGSRSSSEATAYGTCVYQLSEALKINYHELEYHRAYAIWQRTGRTDDEELLDRIVDAVIDNYPSLVDNIDIYGFDHLEEYLK